jgi:NAD(P)-dependent dehydrogenase (short-subunit alcohol dehydrogenase family)
MLEQWAARRLVNKACSTNAASSRTNSRTSLKQLSVIFSSIDHASFRGQGDSRELAIVNLLDQRIAKVDHETFAYAISKKALAEATLAAALQLAPRVRVNGISPGPVFPPKGLESSKMEKTLASLPLKRAVSPDDLADACVMLVENDSITGSILNVDCGQRLG